MTTQYQLPAHLIADIKEALINLGYASSQTSDEFIQDAYFKYIMVRQTGKNPLMPYALDLLPQELRDQLSGGGEVPPLEGEEPPAQARFFRVMSAPVETMLMPETFDDAPEGILLPGGSIDFINSFIDEMLFYMQERYEGTGQVFTRQRIEEVFASNISSMQTMTGVFSFDRDTKLNTLTIAGANPELNPTEGQTPPSVLVAIPFNDVLAVADASGIEYTEPKEVLDYMVARGISITQGILGTNTVMGGKYQAVDNGYVIVSLDGLRGGENIVRIYRAGQDAINKEYRLDIVFTD